MSSQRNYYEILNSTSNASFDELKRNYKQLILQCHPDKLQQDKLEATTTTSMVKTTDPNVSAAHDNTEFVAITEAWNTLKDPVKRKHYDAELLLTKFQAHSNIFEHLTLADMEEHRADYQNSTTTTNDIDSQQYQDTTETFYSYNCRCGGQYIIDESAAADNGIYKTHQKAERSVQPHNTCQDFAADDIGDKNKVAADTDDCEVMVECSECSLVIILSNAKRSSTLS